MKTEGYNWTLAMSVSVGTVKGEVVIEKTCCQGHHVNSCIYAFITCMGFFAFEKYSYFRMFLLFFIDAVCIMPVWCIIKQ